jgi:hypothetical protein
LAGQGVRTHENYESVTTVAGVTVYFKPKIRTWDGWPDSVRETLLHWNSQRRLTFLSCRAMWGGYATGFESLTCKCVECGDFFNPTLSTACELDGRLICDDCIIDLAAAGISFLRGGT